MKKLFIVLALLIAGTVNGEEMPLTLESAPTTPLLECVVRAIGVYDTSPVIAVKLTCEDEILALEYWALKFGKQTGLTPKEVEVLLAEAQDS